MRSKEILGSTVCLNSWKLAALGTRRRHECGTSLGTNAARAVAQAWARLRHELGKTAIVQQFSARSFLQPHIPAIVQASSRHSPHSRPPPEISCTIAGFSPRWGKSVRISCIFAGFLSINEKSHSPPAHQILRSQIRKQEAIQPFRCPQRKGWSSGSTSRSRCFPSRSFSPDSLVSSPKPDPG